MRGHVGRDEQTGDPLPPSVSLESIAELSEGLVCLSGCARTASQSATRTGRLGSQRRSGRALPRRAPAPVRARRRSPERGATRPRGHLGVETVATGDVHAHHPRRTLLQDSSSRSAAALARGLRARAARQPRELLRSRQQMLELFPLDRDAAARSALLAERLEFDLTEELGYRYPDFSDREQPAIFRFAEICRPAIDERYPSVGAGHAWLYSNRRASASRRARLDRRARPRGLLPAPPRGARAGAGMRAGGARDGDAAELPAAGARTRSSVGSIVCYLTGLSHVDPVADELSLGRFLNRELAGCRTSTSTSRVTSARTHRPRHRALRARACGPRRELRDVPLTRRDPRRGEGARAPFADSSGSLESPTAGMQSAWRRRSSSCRASTTRSAGGRSPGSRARSPGSRATSRSTRAG